MEHVPAQDDAASTKPKAVVFSDIDGTIAHELPEPQLVDGNSTDVKCLQTTVQGCERLPLAPLPVSTTGKRFWVPVPAFAAVANVRRAGLHFVFISGARTSTILQRAPFLPTADALITENGGRIFWRKAPWESSCRLVEDHTWRSMHDAVAGPAAQEAVAPEAREGVLWDAFRQFKEAGMKVDSVSYSTAFRVKAGAGQQDVLDDLIAGLPAGLVSTINLGSADVYPSTSGKLQAAKYVLQQLHLQKDVCAYLCDDDNDIELAEFASRAYCPSVSSASMQQAITANEHIVAAAHPGPLGTVEMLELLQKEYGVSA